MSAAIIAAAALEDASAALLDRSSSDPASEPRTEHREPPGRRRFAKECTPIASCPCKPRVIPFLHAPLHQHRSVVVPHLRLQLARGTRLELTTATAPDSSKSLSREGETRISRKACRGVREMARDRQALPARGSQSVREPRLGEATSRQRVAWASEDANAQVMPLEHAAHGALSHRAIEELRREARLHDVPLAWPSFTSPSWVEGNTACNNVSLSCTGTS